jgi:ABC-type multidrug transport system fused ATPase/permease subunit
MIQRIQTVYLMLAFIASALLFTKLPIAVFQLVNVGTIPFNIISKYQNPEFSQDVFTSITTIPLILVNGALVLLTFITVFLYKNRPLQYRLVMIGFLINIILIVAIFFTADSMQNQLKTEAQYKLGAILPLISLVLLILSSKAIRNDEKKVKAADRLR